MTDIVARLRERNIGYDRQAADEIERLRAAIAHVRQRSAKAGEILNEFDNTYGRALEPKP